MPQAPDSASSVLTLEQVMSSSVEPRELSVKVLKALLDSNCVPYAGIFEKTDLEKRLQELIDNTRLAQEKLRSESSSTSTSPVANAENMEEHVCKICYDAPLNCVMLNCGHLSSCLDCGKKILAGDRICPICREYVVNLLQIFRA
ncbi:hypothetical protein BGZ58_001286 [Dissophora ornata]|nr:hypothetical protein BGZ58_001286 [Dissophora ornata]